MILYTDPQPPITFYTRTVTRSGLGHNENSWICTTRTIYTVIVIARTTLAITGNCNGERESDQLTFYWLLLLAGRLLVITVSWSDSRSPYGQYYNNIIRIVIWWHCRTPVIRVPRQLEGGGGGGQGTSDCLRPPVLMVRAGVGAWR